MPATQVNVRIDSELKHRGDKAFDKLGLTPSQVMRAVYSYAAKNGELPREIAGEATPQADNSGAAPSDIGEATSSDAELARDMRVLSAVSGHDIVAAYRASLEASLNRDEKTPAQDARAVQAADPTLPGSGSASGFLADSDARPAPGRLQSAPSLDIESLRDRAWRNKWTERGLA